MSISTTQITDKRMPASARIMRLKERLLSSPWEVDVERARYYTRTWKKMESAPPAMRAAQALKETFNNMSIRIEDDELLVGVKTAKNFAAPLGIERHLANISVQLAVLLRGKKMDDVDSYIFYLGGHSKQFDREVYGMPEEDYRELKEEILPYWQGKDLKSMKLALWKKQGIDIDMTEIAHSIEMQGHIIIGLKRVLDIGFKGISEWAGKTLKSLKEADKDYRQRRDFLESVQVAAEAVCDLSDRYAALAEKMALKVKNQRKTELLQIAERCKYVPANPPRNFIEALQSIWMTQVALIISYGEDAIQGPGRLDQLLYPYYKHDMDTGAITRESAQDLLEEYLIKVSYFTMFGPNNITIGGVDQNGKDATNELSYLFLDANDALKGGLRKSFAVRISPKTPRDFLKRACETYRIGAGVAFYNDNVVIRDLLEDGYSLADARNYSIIGCAEPAGTGNNNGYTGSNGVFITQVLEVALNEGHRLRDGKKVGASTPDPRTFITFEDVKEAFAGQLSYLIDAVVRESELKDQVIAEYFPSPLLSSTIEGCLESGRDISQGGSRYSHSHIGAQGLATVVNSLSAIRWAVFEEKLLTMEEMVNHLRNNFAGAENIRQTLLRKAPKYGNDDPRADELAEWVTQIHAREVRRHKSGIMGGFYRPLMISAGTQDTEGFTCGASPDGRLAKTAVANGMSPANGTELNGATAALHSVARACKACFSSGTSFNMNLSPGLIKTDEGLDKFASMLEAYFVLGGRQIQINPVDVNTLKDAQIHPENYADLTVKVSGYSFRFVDLSKSLQDDIIARTQFSEV
jgi:pyruvate formate-lyase/glycerol dehydratase family glycyl radical enzyme